MAVLVLSAEESCRRIDPSTLRFTSTDDVGPLSGISSQTRAIGALQFGLDVRQPRFHVVVVGLPGTGRTFCARAVARRIAREPPHAGRRAPPPQPAPPHRARRPHAARR